MGFGVFGGKRLIAMVIYANGGGVVIGVGFNMVEYFLEEIVLIGSFGNSSVGECAAILEQFVGKEISIEFIGVFVETFGRRAFLAEGEIVAFVV